MYEGSLDGKSSSVEISYEVITSSAISRKTSFFIFALGDNTRKLGERIKKNIKNGNHLNIKYRIDKILIDCQINYDLMTHRKGFFLKQTFSEKSINSQKRHSQHIWPETQSTQDYPNLSLLPPYLVSAEGTSRRGSAGLKR